MYGATKEFIVPVQRANKMEILGENEVALNKAETLNFSEKA